MAVYEIRELQHQLKVYKHGRYIAALQQGAFRPYIHPVMTPRGHVVTQIGPVDHPHHQGIWFGHQDVDGVNFWNPESEFPTPLMVATSTKTDIHPDSVTFHQEVQWRDGDQDVRLADVRTITVCENLDHTAIDLTVTLRAGNSDIAMGQTKEAGLAVRVADQIDVVDGGRIENAEGLVNESETFDQISAWVDYAGPISRTETAGIAIFPHPGSDGIPWFTRDYGPIYVSPWRHAPLQLAAGTSRTIGARFVAHDGSCKEVGIADIYERFRAELDG